MRREDHGQLAREARERSNGSREQGRRIDEGGPVERHEHVTALLEPVVHQLGESTRSVDVREERVDHGVADECTRSAGIPSLARFSLASSE